MTTQISGASITFSDSTVQSTAAPTGIPVLNVYTSPGTWTKPSLLKAIKVTVVGGGAGGLAPASPSPTNGITGASAGGGGTSINIYPASSLPGPQPYTVGAGVAIGAAGNTSSFGVAPITVISATGGGIGVNFAPGPTQGYGGLGGIGSGGTLNVRGGGGFAIGGNSTPNVNNNCSGGSSTLGGGGIGGPSPSPTAVNGGLYGGGGGTNGTGAAGVVIIEEFY